MPKASGLTDAQMQKIAREFNFSETTFVFPSDRGFSKRVRIFTPTREVPFAGHPNIGTAFVLGTIGELGDTSKASVVTFDEGSGPVQITLRLDAKTNSSELRAPQSVSFGQVIPTKMIASALTLSDEDVESASHRPQVVSAGLPFILTELRDRSALERCRISVKGFSDILSELKGGGGRASVYLYVRTGDEEDIRARMFAPLSGVPEDPATGSATCAVVGLLAQLEKRADGMFTKRLTQGVEMGRPSSLTARAEKSRGVVTGTWVSGSCVMVSEGHIEVD